MKKLLILVTLISITAKAANISIVDIPVAIPTNSNTVLGVDSLGRSRMFAISNITSSSVNINENGQIINPTNFYSANSTNLIYTVLGTNHVRPSSLVLSSSDWNPIVVSGAGTSGANGNYYQSVSNLISGIPYAVWTNSSGSSYRIVYNNTNFVPSGGISGNLWTIENTINVNFVYDGFGLTPFLSWEVSSLGGTPGVVPAPQVGNYIPSLISASLLVGSGGTLILDPGIYVMPGFQWLPTNMTIIADGAKLFFDYPGAAVIPWGTFEISGGSIMNTNRLWGFGGNAFDCSHLTNYFKSYNFTALGGPDTWKGTLDNDNVHIFYNGGEFQTWWDGSSLANGTGHTNNYIVFNGTIMHGVYDLAGIQAMSSSFQVHPCESFGLTQYISSCSVIIDNGFTNLNGAALYSVGSGAAIFVSGININKGTNQMPNALTQTGGHIYINGHPPINDDLTGNTLYLGDQLIRTNFISGQLYTNNYGRSIDVSATITNVEAAVSGTTRFDIWAFQQGGAANINGVTNFCGNQTLGTSLATTNMYLLSAKVPVGFVWTFTNQCAGAGNVANPKNGQIWIP